MLFFCGAWSVEFDSPVALAIVARLLENDCVSSSVIVSLNGVHDTRNEGDIYTSAS